MRRTAVMCLAVVILATACSPLGRGAVAFDVTHGALERRADDGWVTIDGATRGDVVRAVEPTTLAAPDAAVRLAAGTRATVSDDGLVVEVGDVLVEGEGVSVELGDTAVSGTGAYRLQAGVAPRVAVYRGGAEITRPGEQQRLNGLRQLDLSARRLDGTDQPVAYDPEDPVDQQQLGAAIAFDAQVTNLVNAIDAAHGAAPRPPSFYTSFVAVAEPDLPALTRSAPTVAPGGLVGPPADALIGLFLARIAADLSGDDLMSVAETIGALRDDGARWGLVALSLGVTGVDLAGIVDRAVEQRSTVDADTAVAAAAPAPAPPPLGPPPAPAPVPAPPPAPDPAPAPPAAPPAVPPPNAPGGDGVVEDLIGDVLDVVSSPSGLGGGD